MSEHFPDFLRAVISTVANVLLMITLLKPKYSQKVTFVTMLCILAADLGTAVYCYLSGNLTMLAKIDMILFAVLCFAVRPLFKDTFMQWLFSYLTVQNIYANFAEQSGIPIEIELEIPKELQVDSLELSMVVSNLLENAIQACLKKRGNHGKFIHFICHNVGRLLLEMENSCEEDTTLDKDGYPVTHEEGHGIGSKSVLAFARKYDGELIYSIKNEIFQVRLLV